MSGRDASAGEAKSWNTTLAWETASAQLPSHHLTAAATHDTGFRHSRLQASNLSSVDCKQKDTMKDCLPCLACKQACKTPKSVSSTGSDCPQLWLYHCWQMPSVAIHDARCARLPVACTPLLRFSVGCDKGNINAATAAHAHITETQHIFFSTISFPPAEALSLAVWQCGGPCKMGWSA